MLQLQHIWTHSKELSEGKEEKTRKYYKYNKVRHFTKDCRPRQKIKNRSVQENSDNKDSNKEKSFVGGLE